MSNTRDQLYDALKAIVEAYDKTADHIGDSDLDREQPIIVRLTLGNIRDGRNAIGMRDAQKRRASEMANLATGG